MDQLQSLSCHYGKLPGVEGLVRQSTTDSGIRTLAAIMDDPKTIVPSAIIKPPEVASCSSAIVNNMHIVIN
jgi:hypothetical protein